jgi:ubiquinol-cytochrome c reductase cytochrome b subunit
MSNQKNPIMGWIDDRLPVTVTYEKHMSKYYAPKNFNFWYFFGVLSMLMLVNQILTGIWLTMNFTPSADAAFASVEYIMRDVEWGWLLRYLHSTGATFFFIAIYLHMFRAVLYGSYQKPRELIWLFGMGIYLALMDDLTTWIRGDFLISGATLNRFFALHVIAVPLVIVALVVLHLLALHEVGSNNPDGIDIKKHKDENGVPLDGVPFHPFYTVHDMVGIVVFLMIFCSVMFFFPMGGGFMLEYANFEPANGLKTPAHIAPVWYFGAFYTILRAIPDKLLGVIAMGAAIAILFVLPWLDKSPVKSIRYKGLISKTLIPVFGVAFAILTWLGTQPSDGYFLGMINNTTLARWLTAFYFGYFLLMPFYTRMEKTKPVPERVTGGH